MPMIDIVLHSSPIALAVLALLLAFSLASWAIIFYKWISLRSAHRSTQQFANMFWQVREPERVFERTSHVEQGPLSRMFRVGYDELSRAQKGEKAHPNTVANVEHALRRASSSEVEDFERMIPFLATVGSTSPFIGLFGTVVGIMNSFHEIGAKGSANLTTVAPGIAEALIATAAGLLAAIPAVMAYNYFSNRIRALNNDMENFAADFLNTIKR